MVRTGNILWTVVVLLGCGAAARAEPALQLSPQNGVLLLANGEVLRGKITRSGDFYFVALSTGEIHLRVADVEAAFHDLEEAYQHLAATIDPASAGKQLELASWCVSQQLFGYAAKHLSQAMQADSRHPKIPLVERRLKLAVNPPSSQPSDTEPAAPRMSNADLDQLVRGMPAGTVEMFTGTIQPMLINHCASAGCHGPGSSNRLSLLRIPAGNKASRRLTQRNLHATLQVIDSDDPMSSPLLVMPRSAHGDSKTAVFSDGRALQYQQLAFWVGRVVQTPVQEKPQTVNPRSSTLLQTGPLEPPSDSTSPGKRAPPADSSGRGATSEKVEGSAPLGDASQADGKPTDAAASTKPARYTPVDPFDPEIFNRRLFSKQ